MVVIKGEAENPNQLGFKTQLSVRFQLLTFD